MIRGVLSVRGESYSLNSGKLVEHDSILVYDLQIEKEIRRLY